LRTGQVLLAGGSSDGFGTDLATAELFDPLSGRLRPTGNMASEREFHTATMLADGRVLIAGGRRFNAAGLRDETLGTAEIYDPVAQTFSPTGSMNVARAGPRATLLLDGRVLIVGGFDNGPLTSAELYDPATGSFTATGSMIIQRGGSYAATLLANGKVLITGDNATAELYDPAAGLFTTTGVMVSRRLAHTATLLPSGMVLVVGGANGDFFATALASVERYDPVTAQFTRAADLQTGRFGHTATLLPDGSVLVVGGDNGDGFHFKPLSSAEIYK
jgi:large repetitive protein